MLAHARGIPDAFAALTFMAGAVLGFAFVGTLAFGGVTRRFDRDHGEALLIWGSLRLFSVGIAIGVASLVAYYVEGRLAWPLAGFLYTTAYLLVAGAEATAAYEWDHRRKG